MSCIFCTIIAGQAPASVAYRDDRCIVFADIQPITPGHLLVVPLRHAPHLADLDPADGGHLLQVAQKMAAALRQAEGVRCEGVNLWLADGRAAMQDVFHVHLHVIPRFRGDGFGLRVPPGYADRPAREVLDAQVAAIQAAL